MNPETLQSLAIVIFFITASIDTYSIKKKNVDNIVAKKKV